MTQSSTKAISASLLRLRMKSPFFATLALFARFRPTQQLATAGTDGKDIFFNWFRGIPHRKRRWGWIARLSGASGYSQSCLFFSRALYCSSFL